MKSLKVEAIWGSKRAPAHDLTVITQLSFDRMPALFNQCSTYPGENDRQNVVDSLFHSVVHT